MYITIILIEKRVSLLGQTVHAVIVGANDNCVNIQTIDGVYRYIIISILLFLFFKTQCFVLYVCVCALLFVFVLFFGM